MFSYLPSATAAVIGLSSFTLGHTFGFATLGAGVALGCFCIIGFWSHVQMPATIPTDEPVEYEPRRRSRTAKRAGSPVESLLAEGRAAIVLRTNFVGELSDDQLAAARDEFSNQMAFIHSGRVRVDSWTRVAEQNDDGGSRLEQVDAFWMDRTPVTNAQFAAFIQAEGYNPEAPWWPEEARPLISQFVDQTGQPGPENWRGGSYPKAQCDVPVAGVSWYEAAAFAAWSGKRLPTDPEWLKAATWPIDSSGAITQRAFPWGNQLHSRHARLWNEEEVGVADVAKYADGANPSGVRQLIGNVWEWMHGTFGDWDEELPFPVESSLASIRGGAFDTYFQSQATAQFFSAEPRGSRRANIGFRCVVPANEVEMAMAYRRENLNLATLISPARQTTIPLPDAGAVALEDES